MTSLFPDDTRITVVPDGPETPPGDLHAVADVLAERLGVAPGDVAVDSVRPSMGGAWVTVRLFAPITNHPEPAPPSAPCRACRRPFSPTHDISAPGPTSRHPFTPDVPHRREVTS